MRNSCRAPHSTERCKITNIFDIIQSFCIFFVAICAIFMNCAVFSAYFFAG